MGSIDDPIGLALVDGLGLLDRPTIGDYCAAAAEYIREATVVGSKKGKAAQIRLSNSLARVMVADLREKGLRLEGIVAVEIKPVHLAVGRAIWNRFGDVRTFAVNVHLKFPFAVVGGILTIPTMERTKSGDDCHWKSTTHLVDRSVGRFMRAGGRETEGDASHLLEGIAVVAFDWETGLIEKDLPPVGSGLRWEEFIDAIAEAYEARFGEL